MFHTNEKTVFANMLKLLVILAVTGVAFGRHGVPPGLDVRIVGGNDTDISQHKYQLAVLNNNDQICGGVIVSNYWGLTAAHCFDFGIPFNLRVRGGSTFRTTGGQAIYIDEVLRHPKYNAQTIDYDAALMRFAEPFDVPNAEPVVIPNPSHHIDQYSIAVVTGWGSLEFDGIPSETLQEVEVPVVSTSNCRSVYSSSFNPETMFCAGFLGVGGKDTCRGDYGGPAVIDNVLVGLASWGIGCAQPSYPAVYTRVPAISAWVVDTVTRN